MTVQTEWGCTVGPPTPWPSPAAGGSHEEWDLRSRGKAGCPQWLKISAVLWDSLEIPQVKSSLKRLRSFLEAPAFKWSSRAYDRWPWCHQRFPASLRCPDIPKLWVKLSDLYLPVKELLLQQYFDNFGQWVLQLYFMTLETHSYAILFSYCCARIYIL